MSNRYSRKDFFKKTGSLIAGASLVAGFPNIIIPRKKDKLGVALVGLGSYASGLLAPGLQMTQHCELKGIVTGSPHKIPRWQERYGIADGNVYNYQNMHEVANNDEIDVIYIVLPTGLHAKYAIIGAEAGKHVWCEKPMTKTVDDCQALINAANKSKVQLTIGYRMQHEPNTQTIIKYGKEKTYGAVKE
ncbi:MAG TPA: glucose-fructose oxidoreductase, partial [Balneolaceae bacterium]|nr:glucose-fructose oxidoreductase [Balneolaceae bacterium]